MYGVYIGEERAGEGAGLAAANTIANGFADGRIETRLSGRITVRDGSGNIIREYGFRKSKEVAAQNPMQEARRMHLVRIRIGAPSGGEGTEICAVVMACSTAEASIKARRRLMQDRTAPITSIRSEPVQDGDGDVRIAFFIV